MSEEDAKPGYRTAKGSPWYDFMQASIELDNNPENKKPRGYHWFWGLYFIKDRLLDFELAEIQKILPNEHWLKKAQVPNNSEHFIALTQNLLNENKHFVKIEKINFFGLDFEDTGDFSDFIFPIKASFDGAKFFPAGFNNVVFFNEVNFCSVKFCGDVSFRTTMFCGYATFLDATFLGTADFQKTIFVDDASFREVTFSIVAFFSDSSFFGSTVDFNETIFSSITAFSNTKFNGITYFHNTKFLKHTSFIDAKFEFYAPQFYGAKFNNEMSWDGIKLPKFKKHPQDKISHTGKELDNKMAKINYKRRIRANQDAYQNLATKLDNQKKYYDQHLFFRAEMRCRRRLAESFFSSCAFWLYEIVSDYGYRIGRAFGWWLGHIVVMAFIIASIATLCGGLQFGESLPCAISVSFANANPYAFFGFDSSSLMTCYAKFEPLTPTSFAIIKAIQTTLGIVLLFILILTLRTRFRLK